MPSVIVNSTALHPGPAPWTKNSKPDMEPAADITTQCTEVCGGNLTNRSCSKICLIKVYPESERNKVIKAYAIIDDQSKRSLAHSDFFDTFGDLSPTYAYSLKTCAEVVEETGRRARGYKIESMSGQLCFWLPSLIECNEIPNNRSEIPTPDIVHHHPHLRLAQQIPKLEQKAQIMLLLGHYVIRVHKVREQINGPCNASYA